MIAYIKGVLAHVAENAAVVECGGMGYAITMSAATISRLPGTGQQVHIHTSMHVKEDGITLYGFITPEEQRLFLLLTSVSGIGPKAALSLLGAMPPTALMLAIITEDTAALGKAPGIGKKTAARLVLELKDKLKTQDTLEVSFGQGSAGAFAAGSQSSEKQDAIDALLALGYSRSEGVKAVMAVALEDMTTEQILKEALKKLASAL